MKGIQYQVNFPAEYQWFKVPLTKEIEHNSVIIMIIIICDLKPYNCWGCNGGVMVKAMDCGIVVREFVLQSRYYVHFRV